MLLSPQLESGICVARHDRLIQGAPVWRVQKLTLTAPAARQALSPRNRNACIRRHNTESRGNLTTRRLDWPRHQIADECEACSFIRPSSPGIGSFKTSSSPSFEFVRCRWSCGLIVVLRLCNPSSTCQTQKNSRFRKKKLRSLQTQPKHLGPQHLTIQNMVHRPAMDLSSHHFFKAF